MMAKGDMIQVHMLTAYPASLLNRDDAGLAKRIPFGGAVRIRISSQCLKKHWREAPGIADLDELPLADRSTRIYEKRVAEPLVSEHGATEAEALAIAQYLMQETVDTKPVKDKTGAETARSGQLLVLTRAETEFLAEQAVRILEQARAAGVDPTDLKALAKVAPIDKKALAPILKELPASVDTALFGRMVTSDLFARVDAAVSVAHAFTTHAETAETDYFTAVDTLNVDDAGAGLVQDTELTSGVFYTYAVIDMEQLRANLGREAELAERLARNLVNAMATVSPGAKRGSTAPYAFAEFVLLERGAIQPRTLANAFLNPVVADGAGLMVNSVNALMQYRTRLEQMYGFVPAKESVATIHPLPQGSRIDPVPFATALDGIFEG
jgi:CRISPR system Cascade subunit CasC